MNLTAAAIRILIERGLSAVDIADFIEANEGTQSAGARRQKAYRERKKRNERDVTRDVTDTPPNDIYLTPPISPVSANADTSPNPDLPDEPEGQPPLQPAEVVEAWNDMASRTGLPKVTKLTAERRKRLNARIVEYTFDDFTEAIRAVERSAFLRGDGPGKWRANFDFFLQPSSFQKLIEGGYDGKAH